MMRPWAKWVLGAAVLAMLAFPVLAQRRQGGGGGRMGGFMLLGQKSVQDELKLTEDQVKKVAEVAEKMRAERGKLRDLQGDERTQKAQELAKEASKAIGEILNKDQAKRFKQIGLQVQGAAAIANPEIAKELKVMDDQLIKITELQQQARQEMRKIRQDAAGDQAEAIKKITEYRKAINEKILKLLTDEQKAKWKEMTGKPFTGEIRFGQRRRNDN
jgi:Spy/CpxP family protein refolding chaperone